MSVTTAKLIDGILTFLTADSSFNSAIGGSASAKGRLGHLEVVQNETFPYAVMTIVSGTPEDTFTSFGERTLVQFDLYESKQAGPRAALDLLDTLKARLHQKRFTVSGSHYMATSFEQYIGPMKEGKTYRVVITFAFEGDDT